MAACRSCGTESPDVARFCMGCGARLAEAAPHAQLTLAELDGPREERKVVTVLFADLAGFTTRSEGADPEDVRALVRPFHAILRREVDAFGGTLARIVGDAGLAVFGYPVAHEDDAERAVRAGLAILAALERCNADEPNLDLHARIGVNTGEAAVTYGDPTEDADDLMGEAVNAAQRLQATAPVDALVVGEATQAAVARRFALEPLDAVPAKGLSAPLARWRVAASGATAAHGVPQPSPFVGRESALEQLSDELRATREQRAVRLVTVLGEPGIGKGRLVAEFAERHREAAVWRHGNSPAYGEGIAFRALAEVVRAQAGIADDDTLNGARRRLISCISGAVAEPVERRWLTSHVAALLRLGPPPSGGREEAFAAWGTFLERLAGEATVLVFDDLHWADDGMLDFVEDLASHPERGPILVIAIARRELRDRRPAWGAGAPHHTVLELSALPPDAMGDLLAQMVRDLPPELAERIMDRAAGVPLFAVEILRMLADRGDVVLDGEAFRLVREPDDVTVPPGLASLVASRVDALPADERTLLRQASVLGDRFAVGALAAVARTTPTALAPLLDRVIAHALLVAPEEVDPGDSARRIAFSHALVREVAYGTLARRDRRTLHLVAADFYAGLGDLEVSGDVASHVLAAYRAAPVDNDPELVARVVSALRTAGERAIAVHSAEAAAAFLEEALAVATDPADIAELHRLAAVAAASIGALESGAEHGRASLAGFRALDDKRGIARAAATLGFIQTEQYNGAALRTLTEALAELGIDPVDPADEGRDPADEPAVVELLVRLARAYVMVGNQADAEAVAEHAVRRAERHGLVESTADGLSAKGAVLLEACRIPQGSALLWAAVELAERHGFIFPAVRARSSLVAGLLTDDPGQAERIAREGLETARRVGLRGLAVRVASNWADAAVETGRWDDAERVLGDLEVGQLPVVDRVDLESVRLMLRAIRGDASAIDAISGLWAMVPGEDAVLAELSLGTRRAWANLATGRPEAALADAETAIRAGGLYGRRTALYAGTIPAAHAALWLGDCERLARAVDELRESGLDGWWFQGQIGSLEAGLAVLRGDAERAAARYAEAAAVWRGIAAPFSSGLAALEAAQLLPAASTWAISAREQAGRLFEELGAVALADRLRSGLRAS